MRILFICTAHNSLSQRLALHLTSLGHAVTVELALSPELMISASELAQPDVIICPFLTKRVPKEVYTNFMTLIVHPGPPSDCGPSSLDLALIGDSGELSSWEEQLSLIDFRHGSSSGTSLQDLGRRSHWGVTVLQAIEKLDGGPIWAFEQFPLAGTASATMTKSELYRGPVSTSAVAAVRCALDRLSLAHAASVEGLQEGITKFSPSICPPPSASKLSVVTSQPFQGGKTHERPLLKASQRDFLSILPSSRLQSTSLHLSSAFNPRPALNANVIVQRINSADSQPGVLSPLFGAPLFIYGAKVQFGTLRSDIASKLEVAAQSDSVGQVLATRQGAVLVNCGADYPIWIESVRKPKAKADKFLAVKLPAEMGIKSIPSLQTKLEDVEEWDEEDGTWAKKEGTYQQVWIDYENTEKGGKIAYVYFEFYNGATSTSQSQLLSSAITHALAQPITALCLMGGSGYFSNGIALNVIEGASDPAAESWANINAIDDCVRPLLCPSGVLTFSVLRGNAAAGGLALSSCCDVVLSSKTAVLNPHYRALGLTGSEYHSWSWPARCGASEASKFMRGMLPMSAEEGLRIGLVDALIGKEGDNAKSLEKEARRAIRQIVNADNGTALKDGLENASARWCKALIPDPQNQKPKHAEQLLANKKAFLTYHFTSNTQVSEKKQKRMTINIDFETEFEKFRHQELEGMRLDFFHPVRSERYSTRRISFVRKLVPTATPLRFALHRRYGSNWADASKVSSESSPSVEIHMDEEELDSFDSIGDVPDSAAVVRMPEVEKKESTSLSLNRLTTMSAISRTESGGSIPTLSFSNSESLSRPSTAATSPAASRRPSLSDYKSLEQECAAEEISNLELPGSNLAPAYPSSPRPSTITFAAESQIQQSRTSLPVGNPPVDFKRPEPSKVPRTREPSHRFSRMKSVPWFRKLNEKETIPNEEEKLKKKRSTTLRFLDTISKKGKALVNNNVSQEKKSAEEKTSPSTLPLQRHRSMTEVLTATSKEAAGLTRNSIGNLWESKSQTLGRSNSRPRNKQRPSTATAAPEHAFSCYYSEDGGACNKVKTQV